jgi:hypothetical protein
MKNFLDPFVSLREEAGGGEGGGTVAAAGGGAATPDPAAELTALKAEHAKTAKELADTKASLSEKDQAIQFWHGKATAKPEAAKPAEAEELDGAKLLDVIGVEGERGLDRIIGKKGFVSESDVRKMIASEVDRISREGTAVERFPELKDKDSDFYKQTAKNVAELKGKGITGVNATEIAAERTYLQFVDDGKMKPKAQRAAEAKAAEEADDEETEEERIARGAAAGGAGGRRAAGKERRPSETADDKALIAKICEGMGITEKRWRERAEKGVQVGN